MKKKAIMSDSGVINMILASSDALAVGTPGSYRLQIQPLILHGKWEARLIDLSMAPPAAPQNNMSVFVYADFVRDSPIGSSQSRWIYRTAPQKSSASSPIYVKDTSSVPLWFEVDTGGVLQHVEIDIAASDGTPVPASVETVITIQLRRVA